MSAALPPSQSEFDFPSARRALLRYQPATNWVTVTRDPHPRMTIGFGFDVGRREAAEMLARVGLDPAAVRAGRMPISDAQMDHLFDITLQAAVTAARRRVPGFDAMAPERQWALLELIVWLGPDGSDAVFSDLRRRSLPVGEEPLDASEWFDAAQRASPGDARVNRARQPRRLPNCQMTFATFGLRVELVSDDPDLLAAGAAILPPGWQATDGPPSAQFGVWSDGRITRDGQPAGRAGQREASLLRLGAVIRHHVALRAPGLTFVHAGAVEVDGRAIVIPGHSRTGKSTLVAELVRLGARYMSDEYSVLEPSGMVGPFAKPLSLRTGQRDRLDQLVPVPQAQVAEHAVRIGLVVLTSYAPGARWRPSARSRAEGAMALLQNTVSARLRPDEALTATSRATAGAIVIAGQRGEAAEAAAALRDIALPPAGRSDTV